MFINSRIKLWKQRLVTVKLFWKFPKLEKWQSLETFENLHNDLNEKRAKDQEMLMKFDETRTFLLTNILQGIINLCKYFHSCSRLFKLKVTSTWFVWRSNRNARHFCFFLQSSSCVPAQFYSWRHQTGIEGCDET